jgi:hypothetical protein
MFRSWYYNVWTRRDLWGGEYAYYYCNRWCFLTDQHLCFTWKGLKLKIRRFYTSYNEKSV